MFLDGQLRALEARRRRIALRGELARRLGALETGLARTAVRRALADLALGLSLARRILGFGRRR